MAEELKDLGGLVNKDIAFSKAQPNVIYDSKNFRVTTDDGATLAVRSTIKGNTFTIAIPDVPCKRTVVFDIEKIQTLYTLQDYDLTIYVESQGSYTTFSFTYSGYINLFNDFITFINTDSVFQDANISVIGSTYTIEGNNGYINLSVPECGNINIGSVVLTGTVGDTPLGYTPIDENFKNILPTSGTYNSFNNSVNIFSYTGSFITNNLVPISISPTFSGLTDSTNQWVVENRYANFATSTAPTMPPPVPGEYMYMNMSSGVYDSTYTQVSGTTSDTTLLINDVWADSLVANSNPDSAIISYTVLGEALYPNIQDYTDLNWSYDLSYATGNIVNRNYEVRLKVYLYMGDYWNDSGLSYEYPNTNLYGWLDGTKPCALIYNELLTPDLNYLKSSSANLTGTIAFTDTPYSNGADQKPVYIIYLEYKSITSTYDYKVELYLDYFKVTASPINFNIATVENPYEGVANPIIIGWTTLRDDIYLFTTSNQQDPDLLPYVTGDGQIWRFTYDKTGDYSNPLTYNITLVYSNPLLDFTIYRPIANPGMIEARYENEDVQKIYWTDNYNVPRQINVAPSQAAVTANLTLSQLNLIPALTMELAQITEILNGGQLNAGVYQVIYRLKNLNNSESRFSRPSNSIPLFEAPTSTQHVGYYPGTSNKNTTIDYPITAATATTPATGTPINSGKGIRVKIYNVDINYHEIELATIYYKNGTDVPEIKVVKTETIPPTGIIDTYIWGTEEAVTITLGESTAFTTAIRRCKTLAAKKQTLFLGNITIAGQDIEYDTRAYRFPINSLTTTIYDSQGNAYTVNSSLGYLITHMNGAPVSTPYLVPTDHDCIQDYDNQAPTSDAKLLYKKNSNVLGGSGPNLEYEFHTDTFVLDSKYVGSNNTAETITEPFINDWVTFDSLGTTPYQQTGVGGSFTDYSSPYRYSTYVGYKRDEMYRFGLVFYDALDNPTYVNWIGDIRMPHIWMPNSTYDANSTYAGSPGSGGTTRIGVNWFNSSFSSDITYYDSTNHYLYAKPLALKVTILNNPDVAFTHGSVVRAERKNEDKHILGQGLMRPSFRLNNSSVHLTEHLYLSCPGLVNNHGPDGANETWWYGWTMHSPEFLNFDEGDDNNRKVKGTIFPGYAAIDKIDWLGLLEDNSTSHPYWDDTGILGPTIDTTGSAKHKLVGGGTVCKQNPRWMYYRTSNTKNYAFRESINTPSTVKNPNGIRLVTVKNAIPFGTLSGSSSKFVGSTTSNYPGQSVQAFTPLTLYGVGTQPAYDFQPSGGYTRPASGQYEPGNYSKGEPLYVATTAPGLFVELDGNESWINWSESGTAGAQNFLGLDGYWGLCRYYLANYKRELPVNSAYGGNTYFARAGTEYIFCDNLFKLSDTAYTSTIVYGGDTIVTLMHKTLEHFDTQAVRAINDPPGGASKNYSVVGVCFVPTVTSMWKASVFPVETSVPVNYRRSHFYSQSAQQSDIQVPSRFTKFTKTTDYTNTNGNTNDWGSSYRLEYTESFKIDSVFLFDYARSIYRFFPKQPNSITPSTYDCRIWKSKEKTDGEPLESWSIYAPSEYKDVESAYGPLNNLIIFQDKMFYFQDKGFGVAQVDEQKVVASANPTDSDLVLGSSGILERYDYISTKTGTKHQFSMSVSDYSIIWFDIYARKMYRYKPDGVIPVSDIKGLNSYLYNKLYGTLQTSDNPYIFEGIHSTYDFRHNEFYMTFLDRNDTGLAMTIVYNDLLDGYIGEYTHYPKVYINDKLNIFSPNPNITYGVDNEQIYIHNYGNYVTFYDQTPDFSTLSFIVNSNPTVEKVLNNIEFLVESFKLNRIGVYDTQYDAVAQIDVYDFFKEMRIYNNYQNTDWFNLITNTIDYSSRNNYARKHKTIWNTRIPTDRVLDVNSSIFDPANLAVIKPSVTRRLKDKWFMVELKYPNNKYHSGVNNKLVVHSANVLYALNSR